MRSHPHPYRLLAAAVTLGCALILGAAPVEARAPGSSPEASTLLVYPGSFDIFHKTHLAELKSALGKVRASSGGDAKAVVLPNHDRPVHLPFGRTRYIFDGKQRTSLAKAATAGDPDIAVRRPFRDGTPTVDQLLHVAREAHGKRVVVLLGEDAFRGLGAWKGYRQLLGSLDFVVSVAPERLSKLPPPAALLGSAAKRYAQTGAHRFEDARTGQRIEYLGISVPTIKSHAILQKLASHLPLSTSELPASELRELKKPRYQKTLRRLTHTQLSPELVAKSSLAPKGRRGPGRLRRDLRSARQKPRGQSYRLHRQGRKR